MVNLSLDAARWALHFYRDHCWLVFGLSLIPGLQRFASLGFPGKVPIAGGVGGEVVTGAVRLLLVVLLIKIGFAAIERPWWKRVTAGIETDPVAFYLQFVVLALAFVVFDVLPNLAIAKWAPQADQDLATAILLLVKNPTIIAFTFLWMTGIGAVLALRGSEVLRQVAVPQ